MRRARHLLWALAAFAAFVAAALSAAFLLAQTSFAKAWIAREAGRLASRPGFSLAIEHLQGLVPFRMTAKRIAIRDAEGTWLSASGVAIDLSAKALLFGRGRIRLLTVKELRIARLPSSASGRTGGRFALPVLPIALSVDRLKMARLVLAAPVLGERVAATLSGHAQWHARTALLALDLHRTDGVPGGLSLSLALSRSILSLHLAAKEPTGILIDRLFSRTDHPPFTLSLEGVGPIDRWQGRLLASAGSVADLSARIKLSLAARKDLSIAGEASLAPLLPPQVRPLVGKRVAFHVAASFGSRITIERLAIDCASGQITGKGIFGARRRKLRAEIAALVPNLSPLGKLIGLQAAGSGRLRAKIDGTLSQPRLTATLGMNALSLAGAGARKVFARLEAEPESVDGKRQFTMTAEGQIRGLSLPYGQTLPPELSGPVTWSLAARATRKGEEVRLTRFFASGLGGEWTGSGRLYGEGRRLETRLIFWAPHLAKFSALVRRPLAGSMLLEARVEGEPTGGLSIAFEGRGSEVKTAIPQLDALLGGKLQFVGSAERQSSGLFRLDRLTVAAADAGLSASAKEGPGARLLASVLFSVPRLGPLGTALGVPLKGAFSGSARLQGPLDRIALKSGWSADGIDGTLALILKPPGPGRDRLALQSVRLTAPGSKLEGNLQLSLQSRLFQGKVEGEVADLKPWSSLLGVALQGGLALRAEFAPQREEEVRLRAEGQDLRAGSWSLGRLSLTAQIADLFEAPRGKAGLSLAAVRSGPWNVSTFSLNLASVRAGDFAFQGALSGRSAAFSLAGRLRIAKGREELHLKRLDGVLAKETVHLARALALSRRGADLALEGLDLRLGSGRIEGNGTVRGNRLSLRLKAADLPIAPLARFAGFGGVAGAASLEASLGGSIDAPRGHAVLRVSGLKARLAGRTSAFSGGGVRLEGSWDGRRVDITGQIGGLEGDHIGFRGSLPLLLSRAPLSLSMPAEGSLRLKVKGAGDLAHVEGFLPLGEGSLSGHYAVDLAASGTLDHPLASGRVTLSRARYENFTTGAVLEDINADLTGDRERMTLRSFSARDGEKGRVNASGSILLSGGARADLTATLSNFRVAQREEATAAVSGKVRIEGPLASPKIAADLVSDGVELQVPKELPPSIVHLKVTVIDSKTGTGPPPAKKSAPVLPATLDLKITLPGRVFVHGRGLDSEWRGRLVVAGTSAEPRMSGFLSVIRGNFSFLGKSFRIETGRISFAGGLKTNPILDVLATASTSSITAEVHIRGPISAPQVTLSSTPSLPQDEILSQVLFGQGLGQISAAQGLELAQAAAALAGKGPNVLDRLRGGLGLDWLRFGGASNADAILNPVPTAPTQAGATAVSGGKYIGEGISVGVTQGLSPPTSKVTVGIDLRPHLSVETELGTDRGSGIGLFYKYNY